MKVLTIIVSYNFLRWIKPCLESLIASKHPTDILVVDNGSTDETQEVIRRDYPSVRLLANGKNLGFGKANNIGMQWALEHGYEAVFLLNQDAWVDPEVIGTLASLSLQHPDFGIFSPVHLNGDGSQLDKGFANYVQAASKDKLSTGTALVEARFINAAFWFIPARTLQQVGGFSPLFYHYGEDKDYINRLHYHRLKIGYAPTVFGCHDREFRKVSREAFLRSEYVYLLSEYANINYSWSNAIAYGILAGIQKSLLSLGRGEVRNSLAFLRLTGKLLGKSRFVRQTRRLTRQEQAHFIEP